MPRLVDQQTLDFGFALRRVVSELKSICLNLDRPAVVNESRERLTVDDLYCGCEDFHVGRRWR